MLDCTPSQVALTNHLSRYWLVIRPLTRRRVLRGHVITRGSKLFLPTRIRGIYVLPAEDLRERLLGLGEELIGISPVDQDGRVLLSGNKLSPANAVVKQAVEDPGGLRMVRGATFLWGAIIQAEIANGCPWALAAGLEAAPIKQRYEIF